MMRSSVHRGEVTFLSTCLGGEFLLTGCNDGVLRVFRVEQKEKPKRDEVSVELLLRGVLFEEEEDVTCEDECVDAVTVSDVCPVVLMMSRAVGFSPPPHLPLASPSPHPRVSSSIPSPLLSASRFSPPSPRTKPLSRVCASSFFSPSLFTLGIPSRFRFQRHHTPRLLTRRFPSRLPLSSFRPHLCLCRCSPPLHSS